MTRSKEQNKRLYALLNNTGMRIYKAELASAFSDGRTEHTSELDSAECDRLINYLEESKSKRLRPMRRKIFSLAHELGWEKDNGDVDMKRLDDFLQGEKSCLEVKRPFFHLQYDELQAVINQLEIMTGKKYTKTAQKEK